jgi:hypothetical protein
MLRHSHTALSRAQVLQPTSDNSYEVTDTLAVSSGTLTLDGRRNIWRQSNFELAPAVTNDLSPLEAITESTRIRLQRGIRFIDGTEEWVTIATLSVQSAEQNLGQGTLKVSAYDPSSVIDDYRLITPYAPIGTDQKPLTTVEAIKDLVDIALWEKAVWHIDDSIDTTVKPADGTVFTGARWDAINNLAKSLSAIVHVDALGEWHLQKINNGPYMPVDEVKSGVDGVLIGGSSSKDRREMFNAVPLRWEGPTGGGLVFLVDKDPASPTFWDGPFGRRPAPEQSVDTVTTEEQAISAAEALLAQYRGFTATVKFQSLHNPLLEPLDVIEVQVGSLLHEIHVIDAISYPLAGGAMSCSTRAVQTVDTSACEVAA